MLEALAKRTAGLSALLLVLSVGYDFSFLHAAGLSFQAVPTTISDHIRSAIIWAPGIVAGGLVGLIAGLGTPPNQSVGTPAHPSRRVVDLVFFFSIIPSILIYIAFSPLSQTVPMLSLIVGMLLLRFQPGAKNVEQRLGPGTAQTVFGAPALLALVASVGASQGWAFVTAPEQDIQVVVKTSSSERVLQATAIRRFSSTTIIAERGTIQILPSDSIASTTYKKPANAALICRFFDIQCVKP